MGTARHCSGVNEGLFTPANANIDSGLGKVTFAAWLKRDSIATSNALCGRINDVSAGWTFYIDAGNNIGLWSAQGTNEFVSVPCPDLSNWGFVGIVKDMSLANPNRLKVYHGTTAANIALVGSAACTVGIGALGSIGITFAGTYDGSVLGVANWNGSIDQFGLWNAALTLDELKTAAVCGGRVRLEEVVRICDISGDDPEPAVASGGAPLTLSIVGTTVVSGFGVGCDQEIPDPDPDDEFLLTVDSVWRNLEYRYFGSPQAPENIDPRVMILDALTLLPIIEIESYSDLHYVKSWTELDRFDLTIGAKGFEGLRLKELGIVPSGYDFILQVLIQNIFDFAGIIEFTSIDMAAGKDVYILKGGGVDKILQDKLAIPPAGSETDSYDDIAENVMRALVDVNLINPQATDVDALNEAQRTIDLLDQTPNLSAGAIVKVEARNQTVFEAVREAALQDGELGFQVLIVAGQFMFDVFSGVDRSAYVVFALDRDNLKTLSITYDKSNYENWLIMAGAGEGALRALATATVTADQGIKRKERFQDARELATTTLLRERGLAILATEGDFVSITGERMPVSYPQYKIDFDLGDILTFAAPEYALSIAKRVVEVAVTLSQGHPLEVRIALGKAKVRQSNMILRNSLQATSRS